ncbi:MAG: winged helix-turn-helix transcriptional regulator [Candidatus Omnitrophica bacterium]|nr:winged helix-turn-helix transcriptional regulator [Candidatus Omnitrophota bacterium]
MEYVDCQKAATFFRALSHPTRLLIVSELLNGRKCVNDMQGLLKVRQPNLSQHLSFLKLSGIVECRQEGKQRCYCLRDQKLIRQLLTGVNKT